MYAMQSKLSDIPDCSNVLQKLEEAFYSERSQYVKPISEVLQIAVPPLKAIADSKRMAKRAPGAYSFESPPQGREPLGRTRRARGEDPQFLASKTQRDAFEASQTSLFD